MIFKCTFLTRPKYLWAENYCTWTNIGFVTPNNSWDLSNFSIWSYYIAFCLILPSILWIEHWWWLGFSSLVSIESSVSSPCTHTESLSPERACVVYAFPPYQTTVSSQMKFIIRKTFAISNQSVFFYTVSIPLFKCI